MNQPEYFMLGNLQTYKVDTDFVPKGLLNVAIT